MGNPVVQRSVSHGQGSLTSPLPRLVASLAPFTWPVPVAHDSLLDSSRLTGSLAPSTTAPKPKLPAQVRLALRARHYSRRTEDVYVMWIKRFIFFHHVRHPAEMGEPEINAFLNHLALKEHVSAVKGLAC